MKRIVLAFALLTVPLHVSAQERQRRAEQEVVARQQARRAMLEAQVIGRFTERAAAELSLNAEQQRRLARTLQESAERRQAISRRSAQLKQQLNAALRSRATREEHFRQLLGEQRALRIQNQRVLEQEQQSLEQFLSARQQAHFVTLWVDLQQEARRIQQRDPGGPPR